MYVNLNKTICTFWYLTLPLLAINVAWLIMDIILNLEKCVMLDLMYFNKWSGSGLMRRKMAFKRSKTL